MVWQYECPASSATPKRKVSGRASPNAHAGRAPLRVVGSGPADTVELGPGDYPLRDATIPHDAECIGDEPAVLLIIGHHTEGTEASQLES
jgi:hypothetical protein